MKDASQEQLTRRQHEQHVLVKGDNRLTSGVCAGLANYFDVDTVIVRIAFIILLICSYGLILIPYCALAVMLPRESDMRSDPIDVAPAAIESDIYSRVADASSAKSATSCQNGGCAGMGHVPPVSPVQNDMLSAPSFPSMVWATATPDHPTAARRSVVAAALAIALAAFFVVITKLFVARVDELSIIGFFPLLFVVVGTICLVCFTAELSLGVRILCLILCVELCMAFLPFTTGLCPLQSLSRLGVVTGIMFAAAAVSTGVGIIKQNLGLLFAAVCLFTLALVFLYFETGVFGHIQLLSSYSRHNLTSPLFRR